MKDVTLLFLRRKGQLLLAMKKRGFGEGLWNGAGGKVEAGETILEAAIREAREEIGVTPLQPRQVGELLFYLAEDPSFCHHASIYIATEWEGEPHETEEMRPQWFNESAIPYDQMWPDDYLWMPLLLRGTSFKGSVTIADGKLAQHTITEITP